MKNSRGALVMVLMLFVVSLLGFAVLNRPSPCKRQHAHTKLTSSEQLASVVQELETLRVPAGTDCSKQICSTTSDLCRPQQAMPGKIAVSNLVTHGGDGSMATAARLNISFTTNYSPRANMGGSSSFTATIAYDERAGWRYEKIETRPQDPANANVS